jgi:hypothetical protein
MGVVAAQADQPSAHSSVISPEESPVQAVTIPQAAQALDLSVITIRRRLKRGELRGQKVATAAGFEWRVLVPSALVDAAEDEGAAQGTTQGTPLQESRGADQRLIEVLQTQLAELRVELDARRREVQELHVLLARWQPALPPPLTGEALPEQADQTPPDHETISPEESSPPDQIRPVSGLRRLWRMITRD